MKHRVVGRRLDRTTEHRTAMFRNMVTSLLRHERITTTTPKAKELKRIADKIITLAKRATPHSRRIANRDVRDVEVLNKLFGPIADRFKTRPGGYTRLIRVGRRAGDNAELAVIELLDRAPAAPAEEEKGEKAGRRRRRRSRRSRRPRRSPRPRRRRSPPRRRRRRRSSDSLPHPRDRAGIRAVLSLFPGPLVRMDAPDAAALPGPALRRPRRRVEMARPRPRPRRGLVRGVGARAHRPRRLLVPRGGGEGRREGVLPARARARGRRRGRAPRARDGRHPAPARGDRERARARAAARVPDRPVRGGGRVRDVHARSSTAAGRRSRSSRPRSSASPTRSRGPHWAADLVGGVVVGIALGTAAWALALRLVPEGHVARRHARRRPDPAAGPGSP